ncbi:hypothetical protein Drorol1_Dr00000409 [Drosera rotundifolia]
MINCVLRTTWESGLGEYSEKVFDEMSERGMGADCGSFRAMVIGYCRLGLVAEADRWMSGMVERKFVVDHATCTLVISKFYEKGLVSRAIWFLYRMMEMGFQPNVTKQKAESLNTDSLFWMQKEKRRTRRCHFLRSRASFMSLFPRRCLNRSCGVRLESGKRNGWWLRSGELAPLCDRYT